VLPSDVAAPAAPDECVVPGRHDDAMRCHRRRRGAVAWVVLVVSGLLETVWATALARSEGFTRPGAVAVFAVASVLSVAGLGYALRDLPVGTGYAVWVGIGVLGTVAVGVIALGEPLGAARVLCVGLIVAGVVGLKLAG
jgi:quaternary ammonium compound-resistance protein SugE